MLPKRKRITKKTFDLIMKDGLVVYGSFFSFRYIKIDKQTQFAFVVPKKIASKATRRNYLRRRGYLVLEEVKPPINTAGIFFYKEDIKNIKNSEIKKDIELMFHKIK